MTVSPNGYFWLVLLALAGFYLLDTLASWLNVRALEPALSQGFRDIYDEEKYRHFLAYTEATARFEWVDNTFNLAVLIVFWLSGGYGWLDGIVRGFHHDPITSGLLFMGALWLGHWLINLPFEIYETFRIEGRFGFNKTTPATFAADHVKSLALTAVLGGGLLALILSIFERGGAWIWLPAWAITAALLIVFVFIAPAVVLPLFNKLIPLEEGELRQKILAFGAVHEFPVNGIFVMDGSRRSTKANAFFTGFGKTKKIVLFDTLIANHLPDELVAVLAHEIGHYKLRHIVQHLVVAVLNLGVFLFLASHFIHARGLFDAFGIAEPSVYAGLALFLIFYNPLSRLLSVARNAQSRKHEFQADRFAAEATQTPRAMTNALRTLSKNNLSNLAPHPLYVALYHSHPPVLQRIAAIEAL